MRSTLTTLAYTLALSLLACCTLCAQEDRTIGSRWVLHTDLVADALLIPNAGVEYCFNDEWSVRLAGGVAWWENRSRPWTRRVRGGELEVKRWLQKGRGNTGHHFGIFGGVFDYDLAGSAHKGYLSDGVHGHGGFSYGYAWRWTGGLGLDFSFGVGYIGGRYSTYMPGGGPKECDLYLGQERIGSIGVTKLSVSLLYYL